MRRTYWGKIKQRVNNLPPPRPTPEREWFLPPISTPRAKLSTAVQDSESDASTSGSVRNTSTHLPNSDGSIPNNAHPEPQSNPPWTLSPMTPWCSDTKAPSGQKWNVKNAPSNAPKTNLARNKLVNPPQPTSKTPPSNPSKPPVANRATSARWGLRLVSRTSPCKHMIHSAIHKFMFNYRL
jgi:hypothetical protein